MVMVFVHTNGFRKDLPQYGRNIVIKTDFPTNSSFEINKCAQIGLKAIFREGFHYKKAGVIVMGITPQETKQLSFFKEEDPKHLPLMNIVDRLNKSYGNNKIKFGCQSFGRQWKKKQERLSPRYSTNIDEIIEIKAFN
jgi:DNA polymerase V